MNRFEPHWEVLPTAQREFWPSLAGSVDLGLVLYGGTAVALRLGHRRSLDFDFFTEKPLDRRLLRKSFAFLRSSEVIQDRPDTLSVLTPVRQGNVKVSFFGMIDIGRAGIPDCTPDRAVEVASLLDLLATKLKVMQQRIEMKDYWDVAAMLQAGIRLEAGLAAAAAMYRPGFQPSEAVKALTYFEGGDLASLKEADRKLLTRAAAEICRIPVVGLASRSLSERFERSIEQT
ncbi:MAG: nucleotidyl transferase AbiEii/AbiGii toxin family protein [Terracidiphilus sp.]